MIEYHVTVSFNYVGEITEPEHEEGVTLRSIGQYYLDELSSFMPNGTRIHITVQQMNGDRESVVIHDTFGPDGEDN